MSQFDFLRCRKCFQFPKNFVESPCCTAPYCWGCALEIRYCRTCQKLLEPQDFQPNPKLEVVMQNLSLPCRWEGCTTSQVDIRSHEAYCPFRLLNCPYSDNCGIIPFNQLEEHKQICGHRFIPCPLGCDFQCPMNDMHEHVLNECDQRKVKCSNEGCQMVCSQAEMEEHLKRCQYELVPCRYQNYGCKVKLSSENMELHMKQDTDKHLELVVTHVESLSARRRTRRRCCSWLRLQPMTLFMLALLVIALLSFNWTLLFIAASVLNVYHKRLRLFFTLLIVWFALKSF